MAEKKVVAIVFGGKSSEHEVSVNSARNIAAAIDKDKFQILLVPISKQGTWSILHAKEVPSQLKFISDDIADSNLEEIALIQKNNKAVFYSLKKNTIINFDIIFPIVHGTTGEDGGLQGMFKVVGACHVGCGVLSSAAGMDKDVMKRLFHEANIPTPKHLSFTKTNPLTYEEIASQLGPTFFIKPANTGSSVGVHKIKTKSDYDKKLPDSFLYDFKILAEEFINCREVECAVLGLNDSAKASVPGEIIPTHEFYSYEAKYLDDNGAAIKIPADLPVQTQKELQQLAIKTFQIMGCDGMTRVDFFIDKKTGKHYVNEINTHPGFTNISMYPKMWEASGITYKDLISQLIDLGFRKYKIEKELQTNFEALKK